MRVVKYQRVSTSKQDYENQTNALDKQIELLGWDCVGEYKEVVSGVKDTRTYGAEVPFLRPKEISEDAATDLQFFNHTLDWFRNNEGHIPEYFIHLRPTTPLRFPQTIDKAIKQFIESGSEYTALRSCHLMSESSYKTFEIENQKLKGLCNNGFDIEDLNFGRQSYPRTYDCNGYVDIVRSELIQKKNILHGDRVFAYVTEKAYEIDEPSDLDLIEYIINKYPEYVKKIFN